LNRQANFRRDIEGMRGIAVATVVAYHCGLPLVAGGFIGVDIFFVLSGYLITGLLVAEIERHGRLDIVQFYARRLRRLLPASVLTLTATLVAGSLVLAPKELEFAARAGRASAVYLGNVFFALNAADYFAPRSELNPLVHMWSLAVEEQFYLFWPLVIVAGLVWLRSRRALITAMVSLSIGSLAFCVWLTAADATTAFYLLPTRAWEFGAGGLATLAFSGRQLPTRASIAIGWAGVLLVAASLMLITSSSLFPGWVAMAPVAGTCAVMVAGAAAPGRGVSAILSTPPLVRLGGLSYSWYLWHWPFLVFGQVLFPELPPSGRLAAALLSLAAAAASFHLVENPLRYHPALVQRPLLTVAAGVALTFLGFGVAAQTRHFARTLAERPEMRVFSVAASDDGRLPRDACVATGTYAQLRRCDFGQRDAPTRIVLFGDSHAIHWFNPIQSIAEKRRWALTTVLKSGCGAADLDSGASVQEASCEAWRREAIASIVRWRPDLVILGTATNHTRVDRQAWRNRVRAGMRVALAAFAANGLRVVVMRDVPRFAFDVPDCLAHAVRLGLGPQCRGSLAANVNAEVFAAEQEAAQGLRGVSFVDTLPALCRDGVCETMAQGRVMYRDDNHLTGAFAATLQPVIEPQIAAALGKS
jgi:peptidoglycan/LPS O-acetylase OafA/YrhL